MSGFFDLRLAVRSLLKRPSFSLVVVLTMAVGIGANVGVFSYLSYYLWPVVDAPKPHELVRLGTSSQATTDGRISYPDWLDVDRENQVFSQLTAYRLFGTSLKTGEKSLFAWGHAVSSDYFTIFGIVPELGRLIQPGDDRTGAEGVIVLNHLFWTRHFDADPSVVGRTLYLDGRHPYTIVGVAPPGFQGEGFATEIYIPLATAGIVVDGLDNRRDRRLQSMGRLAEGLAIEPARAALVPLADGLDRLFPEEETRVVDLTSVSAPVGGVENAPFILAAKVLMAAVALLLLLACANVANILLARSEARRREMGILAALGASRSRISRRLLTESLLLSVTGGLLGLVLGAWMIEVIEYYLLQTVPIGMGAWAQATSLAVDEKRVAGIFVGVSVLTGLLFGLAPVAQIFRADLVTALKSGGSLGQGKRFGMRKVLVVAQVALSVVLILGAGLMMRTLMNVRTQALGFESRNLMLASVYLPSDRAGGQADGPAVYQELLEGIQTIPGVETASLVQIIPLSGYALKTEVELSHQPEGRDVNFNVIGPDYFETLQIPLLQGRSFDDRDRHDSQPVIVINETAAKQLWPERDPVGQRVSLKLGGGAHPPAAYEVVGVVADSHYQFLVDPIRPQFYLTFQQRFSPRLTFVVRSSLPIATELRQALYRDHPDLAVIDLVPFEEQAHRSLTDQRMNADIATGFGFLGLLLAATGIFSVMSYTVSRRQREFGIRMAVGATARDMSKRVLHEAARLVVAGVVIGLLSAWALARVLQSLLFGISAHDPVTFVMVAVVLAAIGVFAAWLPARRASRVDPITALRAE